jgi:hypothetical protein
MHSPVAPKASLFRRNGTRQTACVARISCARVPVSEGAARSLRATATVILRLVRIEARQSVSPSA